MNIIIDVCLMINMIENQKLPVKIEEQFRKLLSTKSDWKHCIIGTKMKEEFIFNKKNTSFLIWYYTVTSGDKSIKKDYTSEIDQNDLDFDNNLVSFISKNKKLFENYENKFTDIIDDHHIIYAVFLKQINIVFSVDSRLEKVFNFGIIDKLFKNKHLFKKFIGYNKLNNNSFNLLNFIENL